jgi:hypothetical protein
MKEKSVTLIVDNGTDEPVNVRVDGTKAVTVSAHALNEVKLTPEMHRIAVVNLDGTLVDNARLEGDANRRYVFNVAGANKYQVLHGAYCTHKSSTLCEGRDEPTPFEPDATIFEMDGEFMTPLPQNIWTSQLIETRRTTVHAPIHEKHPCCSALRGE